MMVNYGTLGALQVMLQVWLHLLNLNCWSTKKPKHNWSAFWGALTKWGGFTYTTYLYMISEFLIPFPILNMMYWLPWSITEMGWWKLGLSTCTTEAINTAWARLWGLRLTKISGQALVLGLGLARARLGLGQGFARAKQNKAARLVNSRFKVESGLSLI